jgi:hypothetical protein
MTTPSSLVLLPNLETAWRDVDRQATVNGIKNKGEPGTAGRRGVSHLSVRERPHRPHFPRYLGCAGWLLLDFRFVSPPPAGAALARLYKTLPTRHRRENAACYLAAHKRRDEVHRSAAGQGLSENGAHRRHLSPRRRFKPGGRVSRPSPSFQLRPGHRLAPPMRSW